MKRAFQFCAVLAVSVSMTAFSASTYASSTYYRWSDDRGQTVHSDRPPPKGVDYEVISTESSFVRAVDAEEGAVPAEVEPSPGNEFDKIETNKSLVEKNPEFCQRARDNLEVLESSVKIQMRNDDGELSNLSEEDRAIQRKKAEDTIAVHCE